LGSARESRGRPPFLSRESGCLFPTNPQSPPGPASPPSPPATITTNVPPIPRPSSLARLAARRARGTFCVRTRNHALFAVVRGKSAPARTYDRVGRRQRSSFEVISGRVKIQRRLFGGAANKDRRRLWRHATCLFFHVLCGELCRRGCGSRARSPRMLRNRLEDFNAPCNANDIEILLNRESRNEIILFLL